MTTFTRKSEWSKSFIRKENGTGKETWALEVASVNNGPLKLYGRVFIESATYNGPSKEGFSVELKDAVAFLDALREGIGVLSKVSPKPEEADKKEHTVPKRIAPKTNKK